MRFSLVYLVLSIAFQKNLKNYDDCTYCSPNDTFDLDRAISTRMNRLLRSCLSFNSELLIGRFSDNSAFAGYT